MSRDNKIIIGIIVVAVLLIIAAQVVFGGRL